MRIGGIFKANALIGSYLVGQAFYLSHYTQPLPGAVLLETAGGNVAQSVENDGGTRPGAVPDRPGADASPSSKSPRFPASTQLLGLVYALLALAVFIALIGIVNTLMLSVFERTREIGLLRAVGMKRRQIRSMVRSEAVIISVFGAVIGIVVGTGLGLALVSSLKLSNSSVPVRKPGGVPCPFGSARPRGSHMAGAAGGQAGRAGRDCDPIMAEITWRPLRNGAFSDRLRAMGPTFLRESSPRGAKRAWLRPGPSGPGKRCPPEARAAHLPGAPRLLRWGRHPGAPS